LAGIAGGGTASASVRQGDFLRRVWIDWPAGAASPAAATMIRPAGRTSVVGSGSRTGAGEAFRRRLRAARSLDRAPIRIAECAFSSACGAVSSRIGECASRAPWRWNAAPPRWRSLPPGRAARLCRRSSGPRRSQARIEPFQALAAPFPGGSEGAPLACPGRRDAAPPTWRSLPPGRSPEASPEELDAVSTSGAN
jgi:hypothetical protein